MLYPHLASFIYVGQTQIQHWVDSSTLHYLSRKSTICFLFSVLDERAHEKIRNFALCVVIRWAYIKTR